MFTRVVKRWVERMISKNLKNKSTEHLRKGESGAAMAIAVIMVAILSVVALTALAFSSTEARIAGSDLQRTQTFYATASSIEKMDNDFSELFRTKMRPTTADLNGVAANPPATLIADGFTFNQTLAEDSFRLAELRMQQGLSSDVYPRVNITEGPFAGLNTMIVPYKLSSIGTQTATGATVKLEKEFNNYLVPIFQFGIFSFGDMEISPGPLLTTNGRIHSNKNIYALSSLKFQNRVTMAGELVRDVNPGGNPNTMPGKNNVSIGVNGYDVPIGLGSVMAGGALPGGPSLSNTPGTRGYYPGSPTGVANTAWETDSVLTADGTTGRFGGQLLTNTTGATQLKLPLQLQGNSPAEIIKRTLPSDTQVLSETRYHNKATVRILIDDENAGNGAANEAGIPSGRGVLLTQFTPVKLGALGSLRRVDDSGSYIDADSIDQVYPDSSTHKAATVRGIKAAGETDTNGDYIPPGSGIQGKILIEIVRPDGTAVDVTTQILSMGMTEGEPNAIVQLQRPLFAAFMQGSRDRDPNGLTLADMMNNHTGLMDGEVNLPNMDLTLGYYTDAPATLDGWGNSRDAQPNILQPWNSIVPINVYNVREGFYNNSLNEFAIHDRGLTSVVELNMKNLARWLDGVYDSNLLNATPAVSTNIKGDEGYVVYVSDRRGDNTRVEYLSDGTSYISTNGNVDNEDIYGPNGTLDPGEDSIDFGWDSALSAAPKKGSLQKDTTELPDSGTICSHGSPPASNLPLLRTICASQAIGYKPLSTTTTGYFRRAVRLFNGERLSFSAATGKLSPTKGITIASENMVYIWGNYNTTGVSGVPVSGSTLNDGTGYTGPQVPASIVADAIFPLSKTWFDASSALFPEGMSDARNYAGTAYRMADDGITSDTEGTSVRAAIITGINPSALNATPGRNAWGQRKSGGTHNFARFLESWNTSGSNIRNWNYSGSIIELYNSTQALSQWENNTSVIYTPPRRNWSFDQTFLSANKLPPGTPFFQYMQSTGFRLALN